MKSAVSFSIALLFSLVSQSQDCKGYYFLTNGQVKMAIYDKKGKSNGDVTYTISNASRSGSTLTADFASVMVNEKGKKITEGKGKIKCAGNVLLVDARMSMPQEQMSAYKNMDVKATEGFIEYPSKLSQGQKLKDMDFKMEVYNNGSLFSTVTFSEFNRQVGGKESVTTPAGTWDCWKITYESNFKAMMGPIGIPMKFNGVEWFAPGFGVVKTETYKGDKLMGSTAIISTSK